jgi:uncharacterized membrane protein
MHAVTIETQPAPPRFSKSSSHLSRVGSIDSARGAAMLFVCLAHFANAYHFTSGADETGGYIVLVGLLASPTFVTVSGIVAGFLAITRSASFPQLRQKLIDRGVFLLLIGHAILALTGFATPRGFAWAYRVGYITDVIGFAVILGPWLVSSMRHRSRLVLAALIFTGSWAAVFFWMPSGIGAIAKRYLIGAPNLADWTVGYFPLVPWFAVYLAGTVIGQQLGAHYLAKNLIGGHRFLAKVGAASLGFGIAVKLGIFFLKSAFPAFAETHPTLLFSLSLYQKFPPGPVYLTLFGGAGMLLVAGVLEMARRGLQPFLLNQLRQIGLASLFVYVLQFYLYAVLLRSLRLPYTPFWPLLFVASVALLAIGAGFWNRHDGNRFLTVGIGPYLARRTRRQKEGLNRGNVAEPAPLLTGSAG